MLSLKRLERIFQLKKSTNNPSRGLGDSVKKALDLLSRGHVKPCGACKKRQTRLNQIFPYKKPNSGCKNCGNK